MDETLSTLPPAILARAYQNYLTGATKGLKKTPANLLRETQKKVRAATADLTKLATAASETAGGRKSAKTLSGWLEGQPAARHRELLDHLVDRLDQANETLESARAEGALSELQLAPPAGPAAGTMSRYVNNLAFYLETMQDVVELWTSAEQEPADEIRSRLSSLPETLDQMEEVEVDVSALRLAMNNAMSASGSDASKSTLGSAASNREADDWDSEEPLGGEQANKLLAALAREMMEPTDGPPSAPPPAQSPLVISLTTLITDLVQEERIELGDTGQPQRLAERMADALDELSRQHNPTEAAFDWLLDQDDVEEVFLDAEELRERMARLG